MPDLPLPPIPQAADPKVTPGGADDPSAVMREMVSVLREMKTELEAIRNLLANMESLG